MYELVLLMSDAGWVVIVVYRQVYLQEAIACAKYNAPKSQIEYDHVRSNHCTSGGFRDGLEVRRTFAFFSFFSRLFMISVLLCCSYPRRSCIIRLIQKTTPTR